MKKITKIILSLILIALMLIAYWIYSLLSIDYDRLNLARSYGGQFIFNYKDKNGSISTAIVDEGFYDNVCPKDLYKKLKLRAIVFNDKKAISYLYKCFGGHIGYDRRLMWLLYAANQGDKEAIKLLRVKNYKNLEEYNKIGSRLNPTPPSSGDALEGILQLYNIRDGNIEFIKDTPYDFKDIPFDKYIFNDNNNTKK